MQNYRLSLGFLVALLVCVCMGTFPIVNADVGIVEVQCADETEASKDPATEEAQSADQAAPATEEVTLSVTGMT